jgi:hypothetical protein
MVGGAIAHLTLEKKIQTPYTRSGQIIDYFFNQIFSGDVHGNPDQP